MVSTIKLKNMTTTVPVERTISVIESLLASFGASKVSKSYLHSVPTEITFEYKEKEYKVPANIDGTYKVIYGGKSEWNMKTTKEQRIEKCARVSWRIVKDWVHAQLSMIETKQATAEQILFPYLLEGGKTMFEHHKDGRLLIGDGVANKSPFEILSVEKDAPSEQIEKKYKELAKQYHPDVNNIDGADKHFAEINWAWQRIKEIRKKKI